MVFGADCFGELDPAGVAAGVGRGEEPDLVALAFADEFVGVGVDIQVGHGRCS